MSTVEKSLSHHILENCPEGIIDTVTPSLKVQVFSKGKKKIDLSLGEDRKYFDLASLTKIIFTVPALAQLVAEGRLNINTPLTEYLPWWNKSSVTSKKLLTHTAGLPWWRPLYKELKIKDWQQGRSYLQGKVSRMHLRKVVRSEYSDPDFWLLGLLAEELYEKDLLAIWKHLLAKGSDLHFCVNNKPKYSKSKYAPTEKCPWRKRVLQGEVHDDNTWALKGVCTHAGLFGSIDGLSQWGLEFRKSLSKDNIYSTFVKRQTPSKVGHWGLGFMLNKNPLGGGGQFLSSQSVGHTGFTGTSFWFDPKRDLVISVLSNRVHPTRKNRAFVTLRKQIHQFVASEFK